MTRFGQVETEQESSQLDGSSAKQSPPTGAETSKTFQQHGRYRRIVFFFAKLISHIIWWDLVLARLPLIGGWARSQRPWRMRRQARQFRAIALDMGGVMIKLGQFLSARVDVLPVEITEELKGLQDEVPAEPNWRMTAVLEAELPQHRQLFSHIEPQPVAAASLGQAYRAWLQTADDPLPVIIKIQRPGIEQIVHVDLEALQLVANIVMRYKPIRRRANLPLLLQEFAETLWQELDYELEANNAERFAQMLADNEQIYIPAIYRQYSSKRILVMENVEAIKITDIGSMRAAGINPAEVAEALLDSWFFQIFQERFFHADPHPGNLFVRPREDLPWQADDELEEGSRPFYLIFIDFGMVGQVPEAVSQELRTILVAVLQQDGRRLVEASDRLGLLLPGADLDRIADALTVLLKRMWGRNLLQLSRPDMAEVQELTTEFRDLLYDFPIQAPQNFIYLGRAIGMISGLVSQLDETINPWYYFEKYGRRYVQQQEGTAVGWQTVWEWLRPYLSAPNRLHNLLDLAEKGQLQTQADPALLRQYGQIEKRLNQLGWSVLGAAGMISATLIYLNRKKQDP